MTDTRVNWRAARGGPFIPGGLVYRDRLYILGDGVVITCYNAGDGTTIWRSRLGGSFTAGLLAADGRLYATNERGTVVGTEIFVRTPNLPVLHGAGLAPLGGSSWYLPTRRKRGQPRGSS